jgi:hypothetical protein
VHGYTDGEEHDRPVGLGLVLLEFIKLVVVQLVLENHEEHYIDDQL